MTEIEQKEREVKRVLLRFTKWRTKAARLSYYNYCPLPSSALATEKVFREAKLSWHSFKFGKKSSNGHASIDKV